ncbi:MAG: UDP-N-acetylmuramoyl-L-alanine--D-glutamate ligase [Gemmatimonadota bacterium]
MLHLGIDPLGEVAVIGLGKSGVAASRLLRSAGHLVYASDAGSGPTLEKNAAELRALGVVVDVGSHNLARIGHAALAVLSPGVPPDAPPVVSAREAGVPIRAEVDLGLEALGDVPYIAVTGTNGKTTTTALIGHLLAVGGVDALAAGNIGTPLSEVALRPVRPAWLAVELSSFQLHDAPRVAPRIGVLTNLAPDHLDRYGSLADYYADKRLLFRNATASSIWVTNADDAESARMIQGVPGRHLRFSTLAPANASYDVLGRTLMVDDHAILPRSRLPLLGDHNVANALAATLAVRAAGVSLDRIGLGLTTFTPLAHRMEPVGEVGGVLWINDSKATNVASTEVAIAAMDRPFVLLLGGRHKGEPYTRLAEGFAGRCRAVVAYGEAKPIIAHDLLGRAKVVEAGSFEEVMASARALARRGDTVLLSPACSSYDMFANYEQRGARFREIVRGWQ